MKGAVRQASCTAERQRDFRSRWRLFAAILMVAPWWWWKARPSDLYLTEHTAMIFIGIIASIAAIGVLCCLLFYLAVYALPSFAGVTVGAWAYGTGAGWLGAIAIGFVAGLVTLGVGQLLLGFVKPLWLRLAIAIAFVAPAAIAGYHATHGIVKHTMPSETWQVIFSVVGAIAVGVTAFVRATTLAGTAPSGQGGMARA